MKLDLDNPPAFRRWDADDIGARFATSDATRLTMMAATINAAAVTQDQRSLRIVGQLGASLEERLFASRAAAKVQISQVAMWMKPEWRNGLFKQLDSLLDPGEWDADDEPLSAHSFASFLRSMFYLRPAKRPGLGVSSSGNIIAIWSEGVNRLTVEYLPTGITRWIVANSFQGEIDRIAGDSPAERLAAYLGPYIARGWFCREHD